ncbi:MAG: glycosyltransferase family 2 protein [Desulfomonilaceae bacterium]
MRGVSIIVPAYNSSKTLVILVQRISETMNEIGYPYELILVNDGSPDQTWQVIYELASANAKIFGVNLSRNFGQHNALLCGVHFAKFQTCVTLDDDLQHPPKEIPKLLAKLEEGFDVVYGVPIIARHGLSRNFSSRFVRWIGTSVFRIRTAHILSAFRAFRTDLFDDFNFSRGEQISIDAILHSNSGDVGHVTVSHERRYSGKSNYSLSKLFKLSMTTLIGFKFQKFLYEPGKISYQVQDTIGTLKGGAKMGGKL